MSALKTMGRVLLLVVSIVGTVADGKAHSLPAPYPLPLGDWQVLPTELQSYFWRPVQYQLFPFRRTAFRVQTSGGFVKIPAEKLTPRVAFSSASAYQWAVLVSGSDLVNAPLPSVEPFLWNGEVDLLLYGRALRRAVGMRRARDEIAARMLFQSRDGGAFEQRIIKVNAEKDFVYPDALSHMTVDERRRCGVYLSLGFQHRNSRSPKMIRQAAKDLQDSGVHARVVDLVSIGTMRENAVLLRELLERDLQHVDRAMLVAFSKGGGDIVTFMLEEASKLSAQQRAKIRVVVCMSGTLRGSFFSQWATNEPGMTPRAMQLFMNIRGRGLMTPFSDLRSIAVSPWQKDSGAKIRKLFPGLLWINFPALPAGPMAETTVDPVFKLLGRFASSGNLEVGPHDGVVESAASILPPATGIEEWIVRVYGSHAILDGHFDGGGTVSQHYLSGAENEALSGSELMDQLMRALPRSAIDLR